MKNDWNKITVTQDIKKKKFEKNKQNNLTKFQRRLNWLVESFGSL